MDTLLLDLRLGWRSLRRNTAFSAAALLTLALGIGGTCAIFGVLNGGGLAVRGVRPAMGRAFLPDEEERGVEAGVALISAALWRSRLAADPGVLGRTLQLDGRTVRIVGVMPPGYRFPYRADVWLPARIDPASPDDYAVFARMAPGHALSDVRAELRAIAARMRERDPRTYPGLRHPRCAPSRELDRRPG